MTREALEKRAKEYARKAVYYGAYIDKEAGMEIAEEAYIEGYEQGVGRLRFCCTCKNGKSVTQNICMGFVLIGKSRSKKNDKREKVSN